MLGGSAGFNTVVDFTTITSNIVYAEVGEVVGEVYTAPISGLYEVRRVGMGAPQVRRVAPFTNETQGEVELYATIQGGLTEIGQPRIALPGVRDNPEDMLRDALVYGEGIMRIKEKPKRAPKKNLPEWW